MIDRRAFIVGGVALVAAPHAAEAMPAAKFARIGYLGTNRAANPHLHEAFHQGLRDLGYVEGRHFVIEYRDAEGKIERLSALAAELVALKLDVIVAPGTPQALAAKQATTTIPIVFSAASDPVPDGLVTSLARPGGNVTGLSTLSPELVGKGLEQLKQAVPQITRLAVLWQPGALGERTEKDMLKGADSAGRALGARLQFVEARGPTDFERIFSDITRARSGALTVLPSGMFLSERRRLAGLAARNRLPALYPQREFVDVGGLMAYGPNVADLFRRAATYVDKILKGAKPRRPSGRAADQVRPRHQPQNGQGARPHHPAVVAAAGGSGDRVNTRHIGTNAKGAAMHVIVAIAALMLSACATGAGRGAGPEGLAAATAAWRAAYDSRDPARITAMYDSDAVLWGTTAKTVAANPAAIAEYFKDAAKRPNARVTFGEQHNRVYGDVGVSTGYYTFSDVRDGQAVSRPARYTMVFRNRDGKWRIVSHHSSEVPK